MHIDKVLDTKGSTTVLTIPAKATLKEFVKLACERNIGALLAVDEKGKGVGIISERDILRQVNAGADFAKKTVAEVMTRDIASVSPKDDINTAMDLMVTKGIRHLPVLSDGKVQGLITVRDIMRAMRKADEEDVRYLIEYLQESMKKEPTSL
jgi:CBS domain-containing protein